MIKLILLYYTTSVALIGYLNIIIW